MALINNLGIVYHQYCSSSYLDYPRRSRLFVPLLAMEIKFELDTNKAVRATDAISIFYAKIDDHGIRRGNTGQILA